MHGNFETLLLEQRDDTLWVKLHRPQARNAFDAQMISDLHRCFETLTDRDDVRAVVLTGEGKVFCAGADIHWMKKSAEYTEAENKTDARNMLDMFDAIDRCPKFTIAAVNGHSLGGGMGLIACCDASIAVQGSKLGFTETRLGIVPAVISNYCYPKIGHTWARRLFMTGEVFGVDRAQQIGLVHDVVENQEALHGAVQSLLADAGMAGPNAMAESKLMVAKLAQTEPAARPELTVNTIARLRVAEEAQQGFSHFFAKKPAPWVKPKSN